MKQGAGLLRAEQTLLRMAGYCHGTILPPHSSTLQIGSQNLMQHKAKQATKQLA
jgi:hypothetical protein